MREGTELYHGDCLDVMKKIPDNSIDLILTDPPYLMNYKTGYRKDKSHKFCSSIPNDNNKELIIAYIEESYRILKDNTAIYMFCNSNKIDFFKQELQKLFNLKNIIIWVKNNHTAGDLKCQYGKQYEMILFANKGKKPLNGERLTDIWNFARVSGFKLIHQNQKPIDLLKRCILKSSYKDDIIFDGFMGSGSTGIACLDTGRKFIGVELDDEYFSVAEKRIEAHILSIDKLLTDG